MGPQALHQGVPASIWQLQELRAAFGDEKCAAYGQTKAVTVAGWQCQFPGVDIAKPTRLFSDIPGIEEFCRVGWPVMDSDFNSRGPLPRYCGHNHKQKTIGTDEQGGFHTSPTAAYPPPMCEWIATKIYRDWVSSLSRPQRGGRLTPRTTRRAPTEAKYVERWAPWTSTADEAMPWHGSNEIIPADDIEKATALANSKGIDQTIKDGIDQAMPSQSSDEEEVRSWSKVGQAGDETTDEERELGGMRRPKRGEGAWGAGPSNISNISDRSWGLSTRGPRRPPATHSRVFQ